MPSKKTTQFKPSDITEDLLRGLKDRTQFVITKRFGLGGEEKMTLESIGNKYGITRERVRQIENFALNQIRKSPSIDDHKEIFVVLRDQVHSMGGIVAEHDLLETLASEETDRNHIHFILVLSPYFNHHGENSFFHPRWSTDEKHALRVHDILRDVHQSIKKDELLNEEELLRRIHEHESMEHAHEDHRTEEIYSRWLRLAKALDKNPLDEWGHADSPNIKVRGMRDYAYLAIRNHGSPLHFKETAEAIKELFGKDAHVATTHNELIKDKRFVLIGRGVYALAEWGYKRGVVRDVIRQIFEEEGPLSREEIVDKVLKERYLKRNTILVNLQNPKYFSRLDDGRYFIKGKEA